MFFFKSEKWNSSLNKESHKPGNVYSLYSIFT